MKARLDRKEFNTWMKFYGYTQKELTDIIVNVYDIDVNYRGLNKMINGSQRWTIEAALSIAKVFEIPFEQLFNF